MTRMIVGALGFALATVGLTACGHSAPAAGKSLAQQACLGSGAQAAASAAQAARLNPAYDTLAADEAQLAANESQQNAELSDGSSPDDSSVGGLTSASALGTTGGIKVLTDCVTLGLKTH